MEVLRLLKEARKTVRAPVDQFGCDRLFDPHASPPVRRFQILVSLMLSSQTKDEVTAAAIGRLQVAQAGGLTPQAIADFDEAELAKVLKPVGFYRQKAKHLKQTARIILSEHGGDLPADLNGLVALPGVGPKMAHLCMRAAWGICTGIGVDTHVHRVANRLGWAQQAKTPEQTREQLEELFPPTEWANLNELLVGWGQMVCLPRKPRCGHCALSKHCEFNSNSKLN